MQIGFIGLGIMGRPMAENLVRAGHSLVVYNRTPEKCESLRALGARVADSPADLAESCGVIFSIVPDSPHTREVLQAPRGVLSALRPGTVFVDMSSVAPQESIRMAEMVAAHGGVMLDAPVSGGEQGAIDATLAFMVGGPADAFRRVQPLMLAMGRTAVHVGGQGAGCACKLANQIIVHVNIAAVAEALILAEAAGVDPARVFEAIRGGLAGSAVLESKAPLMLARRFAPGARLDIVLKDMNNVMREAHERNVPLPLSAQVLEMLVALSAAGYSGEDHASIIRYYEQLTGIEVYGHDAE